MPRPKILLVDDSDVDRELIRIKLRRVSTEFELIESESAKEALKVLQNTGVDCILSDFQMPHMDGLEFLSALRHREDDTPFIFITGQGSEEVAAEALREGAEDYFTKDESFAHYERLSNSITRVIDNYQTRHQKKLMEDERRKRAKEMKALLTLGETIRAELSHEGVIKSAIDGIVNAVSPDFVLIFSRSGDKLEVIGMGPDDSPFIHSSTPEHKVGECLCGLAVQSGRPVYSRDIYTDERCSWTECKEAGLSSFAAVPLLKGDEAIGVVGLASATKRDFQDQGPFLETITATISAAKVNALKYQEAKEHARWLDALIRQVAETVEINTNVNGKAADRIAALVKLYRDRGAQIER